MGIEYMTNKRYTPNDVWCTYIEIKGMYEYVHIILHQKQLFVTDNITIKISKHYWKAETRAIW